MDLQLLTSLGLISIGIVASSLIYVFGARRIADAPRHQEALRWTVSFALSISTFFGALPFLNGAATWLLLFPFFGVGLSLDSIAREVTRAKKGNTSPITNSVA